MMVWIAVLIGSLAVYSWKLFGFMLPDKILKNEKLAHVSSMLTIALLSGLVGIQSFTTKGEFTLDSRLPAVAVAIVLNILKVPFILMVAIAAGVAAATKFFLGW
jgi:hypothetical protein